ncbi:hypothetical protein Aple_070670 [Acrocarpospora pleiomorpha]|uniref:Uncharacterized protein n=1 Tax=Acrocarpospora pleiomorpha TaxID=90975 RepID=A0A5M3Y0F2_9ACTN|nr:hypothetical protein Aple_070670 [Acrocarpospora pleiomorpha]
MAREGMRCAGKVPGDSATNNHPLCGGKVPGGIAADDRSRAFIPFLTLPLDRSSHADPAQDLDEARHQRAPGAYVRRDPWRWASLHADPAQDLVLLGRASAEIHGDEGFHGR